MKQRRHRPLHFPCKQILPFRFTLYFFRKSVLYRIFDPLRHHRGPKGAIETHYLEPLQTESRVCCLSGNLYRHHGNRILGSTPAKRWPPVLIYCWSSVADGGPTLKQHWLNVPRLLVLPHVFTTNHAMWGRVSELREWLVLRCLSVLHYQFFYQV